MSSQSVAQYLYEVGSNERKLQYCRQLLSSNPNFIPQCVFNINNPQSTSTQPKSEFIANIRKLELGCNQQEQNLLYSYFQLDGKSYITFGQYTDLLLPQNDQAVKKIVNMRKKQEFTLDYSLRYALQKFFFQVIANQVKLEILCKFTFPKDFREDKLKGKRLDPTMLSEFMKTHGKYPDAKMGQLIVREMNLNKGDCKRHRLIIEYISEYNEKSKKGQKLPEVHYKEPLVVALSKKESRKENKIGNTNSQVNKNDFTYSKIKPVSGVNNSNTRARNPNTGRLSVSAIMPADGYKGPNMQNISSVEKRINELMSEVKVKKVRDIKDSASPSPIRAMMMKKDSILSRPMNTSSVVESVRKELREERAAAESKISVPDKQYSFEIKGKNNREDKSHTDREVSKQDFNYEALTSPHRTDRAFGTKSKAKEDQFERDSNIYSQVVYKPKSRLNVSMKRASPEKSQVDQKRIDYLKDLLAKNP